MGRRPIITSDQTELLRRLWFAGCSLKEIEHHVGLGEVTLKMHAHRQGWPSLQKVRQETALRIADQFSSERGLERMREARVARRIGIPMRAT